MRQMYQTVRSRGRTGGEAGFALALVLVTFLLVAAIGLGVFSVVASDLHGTVANQLAIEVLNIAEAGADHAVGQLYVRALADPPTDESYTGQATPIDLGRGRFQTTVDCVYPSGVTPPGCLDDPATDSVDERDLRHIVSTGTIYAGRARRQIEVWVSRSAGGSGIPGVCGLDGVVLHQGTTIAADVASNRDVDVQGPRRNPGSIRSRDSLALAPTIWATAGGASATPPPPPLNGRYTWKVSYVHTYGTSPSTIESMAGPPTTVVTLVNEYGRLTNIPEGDASVVRRRIYRTRANEESGPWWFAGEIAATGVLEFVDTKPDAELAIPEPEAIFGNASAGDDVLCSQGCPSQIDGVVRSHVRDVLCPALLPPPCNPDPSNGSVPATLSQSDSEACPTGSCPPNALVPKVVSYADLALGANAILTVNTPTTYSEAEFHIHVTQIELGQYAKVVVTGAGKVFIHVAGRFHLGQFSEFGVTAPTPASPLVWPADRVQLLSCAADPRYDPDNPGATVFSVVWDRDNRVAALVFAPKANIDINQRGEYSGSLYGQFIDINQATGFKIDQGRGFGFDLRGAFQYVQRWYDNPRP